MVKLLQSADCGKLAMKRNLANSVNGMLWAKNDAFKRLMEFAKYDNNEWAAQQIVLLVCEEISQLSEILNLLDEFAVIQEPECIEVLRLLHKELSQMKLISRDSQIFSPEFSMLRAV